MGGTQWPKLNPNDKTFQYLNISGPDNIRMDNNGNLGQKNFWDTIDFNENKLSSAFSGNMVKEEL